MKPIARVAILCCAVAQFSSAQSPPSMPGTYKVPLVSQAAGAFAEGLFLVEMKQAEKNRIQTDLRETRQKFWAAFPAGPGLDQAQQAYARALFAKDHYIFEVYAMDEVALRFKTKNGPNVGQLLASFEKATGYIEPIHAIALPDFKNWAETLMQANLNNSDGHAAFQKALPEFQKYSVRRDLVEFLFANPRSPIFQDSDPVAYFAALFAGSGADKTWESALAHAKKFDSPGKHEALHQAAIVVRSYQFIDGFRVGVVLKTDLDKFLEYLVALKSGGPELAPPGSFVFDSGSLTDNSRRWIALQETYSLKLPPQTNGAAWKKSVSEVVDQIGRLLTESQAEGSEPKAAQALELASKLLERLKAERADSGLQTAVSLLIGPLQTNQLNIASVAMWKGKVHMAPQAGATAQGTLPSPSSEPKPSTPVGTAGPNRPVAAANPAATPAAPAVLVPAPALPTGPLLELQSKYDELLSRAAQTRTGLGQFAARLATQKMTMRGDMAEEQKRLEDLLRSAFEAIRNGDKDKAAENLRYAEGTVVAIEKFLGH
jgi:hypothetical protein